MRTIRSVATMQRVSGDLSRQGRQLALVPTMGYLHEGHMSLVRIARQHAGPKGVVIVSIYVNPTQFGPCEDFSQYPRDLSRDFALCLKAGVDILFTPLDEDMYAGRATGDYSTYVVEEQLSANMEGASRPTHFRGVTTVVAKLFNIARPDVAVFGAKDWQQAAVIQRMARDLNFPTKVIVAPTVRESDGLAMSSRNKYLTGELRKEALVLWRALGAARRQVGGAGSKALPASALKRAVAKLVATQPHAVLDYVEFFEPRTLKVQSRVTRGTHMALAVRVGKTRLIDNARL